MKLLIYSLIKVPVISVRYFSLIKDVLCDFVWFIKNIKRMFTVFIYSYLYNSITKCYRQNFAKPFAFRKTSIVLKLNTFSSFA